MKHLLIFLNGPFQQAFFQLQIDNDLYTGLLEKPLQERSLAPCYAVDGGLRYARKYGFSQEQLHWIGDADSLSPVSKGVLERLIKAYPENVDFLDTDKDVSDFGALLDNIQKNVASDSSPVFLEVYGGLGGRRDHENANVFEARHFLQQLPGGGVVFFHASVVVFSCPVTFLRAPFDQFSLFTKKNQSVVIQGARYEGNIALNRPSHGLSNYRVAQEPVHIDPQGACVTMYFFGSDL